MKAVENAIASGRCSIAVSGALLRDPEVVLALKDRETLVPMTLAGAPVSIVGQVSERGLARAVAQPNGVLVLIEPELADGNGVADIAKILARAPHKPTIQVVARQFNPFAFGALSGFKLEHIKGRGKAFVKGLPMPPAGQEAVKVEMTKPKKAKKAASDLAPRFCFTGREEELETLSGLLAEPGPIVVSGPHGIGKHLLVEHALAASDLQRFPDLTLGRVFGFDALVARLAEIGRANGAKQLHAAAGKKDATPASIIAAAVEMLGAVEADGVMFIDGLHTALGRQNDFFRKSRLEMLLTELLTTTSRLRLLFTSFAQPILYREGQAACLRRLKLGGVKGRFLHEIFEAYKAPEFPRDRFGMISEKIGGHPLAARTYAIDVRDREDGLKLTEDVKYLKLEDGDLEKLKRRLSRKVEKLSKDDRADLARIAHIPHPVNAKEITKLGINRKGRLSLLSQGLLDMTGTQEDRRFRVHPLIRSCMTWRETSDFDVLRGLADQGWLDLKDAEGLDKIVQQQIFNHYCAASRQQRRRVKTDLPDNDGMVESCYGMVRSKKPNFTLARQRLAEILNAQPGNADAHLLRLELADTEERASRPPRGKKGRKGAPPKAEVSPQPKQPRKKSNDFEVWAEEAISQAPVPEVFHEIVGHHLRRRNRNKAISTLEKAVAALPEEARLHCRLGALLLRAGRRKESIEALKKAMELQPMLPDPYGLLGMSKRDEGAEALDEAETLLREAVRLAPGDPVQTARLADLLIDRAATETDAGKRSDRFSEAKELLEGAMKNERDAPEAQLLMAQLHRRSGGDLERAEWLLKQSKKGSERRNERLTRIHLERALLLVARGDVDGAEALARDQVSRNSSNHRAYSTLSAVLEARQQFIPAHAELLRAKERAPAKSLWGVTYDTSLARLQSLIEAQVAGMVPAVAAVTPPVEAPAATPEAPAATPEPVAPASEPVPVVALPEPVVVAPEAAVPAPADTTSASETNDVQPSAEK